MDLQCRPPSAEQAAIFEKFSNKTDDNDYTLIGDESIEIAEALYYTKPTEIPKTEDRIVYTLQQCRENTAFAIYCLFQDLTYIRLYSARAWREFSLGAIGLQTATFCTNFAYRMLTNISEKFMKAFGRFRSGESSRVQTRIDSFFSMHCGSSPLFTDLITPDCENTVLARNATRRLGFYITNLACSRQTRLLFDAYVTSAGQHWGNSHEDTSLLKSLYQLRLLRGMDNPIAKGCRMDCMYSAALPASSGPNCNLDTENVFAAQMLWDIQREVDIQIVGVEAILFYVSDELHKLYTQYRDVWFSEELKASRQTRTSRMVKQHVEIGDTLEEISMFFRFQPNMDLAEQASGRQCPLPLPGFQLMRHIPQLVGQLISQYRFEYQESFMDIANDQGCILTAIHFYNAAKECGALQKTIWQDMEWLMHRQSFQWIFAGESPTDTSEYATRFCLVYGLDEAKFEPDRKQVKLGRVKNDIRIKGSSPRRIACPADYVQVYSNYVKGDAASYTTLKSNERIDAMEEFADEQLDKSSAYGAPNLVGYLIVAKEKYDEDEEALNFNVFDFHLRCFQLLKSIRDMCARDAPNDYPAVRFARDDGINPTVAELLRDLMEVPRHHEPMWPKAVKLLRDYMVKDGSHCGDMASGRLELTTLKSIEVKDEAPKDTKGDSDSDTVLDTPSELEKPFNEIAEQSLGEDHQQACSVADS